MNKKLIVIAIALAVVALPVVAAVQKATLVNSNGDKVVVTAGSSEAQKFFGNGYVLMGSPFTTKVEKVCDCSAELGGFYSPDITGIQDKFKEIAKTSVYATTTLTMKDSGTTYLLSASGTTITLPAVTKAGARFRFVVDGALDTGNVLVTSAEGDNIEGSIIVAGAVVDCNAADVLTFVVDGENLGDFVEVMSTGTYWVPLQSGVLTGSKLTCSG